MILLGALLAMGLLLGWGLGGSLRNLAGIEIRFWPALPLAVALQFVPIPVTSRTGHYASLALLLLSYVILLVVLAVNWRLRAFPVIALGVAMNAVVIGINQGMPVSRDAIYQSENLSLLRELPTERRGPYHEATEGDLLLPLADVIAVREPFGVVISVGDVATYCGAAAFLTAGMLGRARRRLPEVREPPTRHSRARRATAWESRR